MWLLYYNAMMCDIVASRLAGVCAMCGKQVLDTKFYKQSNV